MCGPKREVARGRGERRHKKRAMVTADAVPETIAHLPEVQGAGLNTLLLMHSRVGSVDRHWSGAGQLGDQFMADQAGRGVSAAGRFVLQQEGDYRQ